MREALRSWFGRTRAGPFGDTATDGAATVLKRTMELAAGRRPDSIHRADDALAGRLAVDLDGAFPAVVAAHQDRLFTIALRILGDARDAEEVAQDALVRGYRAIAGYPPERTAALCLRPWLAAILVNLARNRRRRLSDRRPPDPLEPLLAAGFEPLEEGARGPADTAARRESIEELAALLLGLPVPIRAALVLRHVDGLPVAETAEVLGRPEGTIKAQVSRGLARLREQLAERADPTSSSPPDRRARARSVASPMPPPSMATPRSIASRGLAAAEVLR